MTAFASVSIAAQVDLRPIDASAAEYSGLRGRHPQWSVATWPRVVPGPAEFGADIEAMASRHAANWKRAGASWAPLEAIYNPGCLLAEARAALLHITDAYWGGRLLTEDQAGMLLRLLDEPGEVLEPLRALPLTLIEVGPLEAEQFRLGDSASSGTGSQAAGPAAYDLARFYSSARWWYGRAPLPLAETRNRYLRSLNSLLDEPVDRSLFDASFDAALAWRFALLWPPVIVEHHICLLARLHHVQMAVIEPALASLRRIVD